MTNAKASSVAAVAIGAGYQVNVFEDGLGSWHVTVQPAPGGAPLTAALVDSFAVSNSITNAIVGSVDLY